jgi:hypothetical protein
MGEIETDLLKEITAMCDELGVCWIHLPDSRSLGKASGHTTGFPDLFLVGRARVAFREVKGRRWAMRKQQTTWKYRLQATGQDWGLWTEVELRSGQIRRELETLARSSPAAECNAGNA